MEFQFGFTLTLKGEDDANVLLPMPKGELGDYLEAGNEIEFKNLVIWF